MADQPDLTPDQEEEVRRLLADARHTQPIPPEVADRLSAALAGLADEPVREATVVRLAHRRRRALAMLGAAAVVVVGGVALGQVVGGGGEGSDQTAALDDGGDGGGSSRAESAPAPEAGGSAGADADREPAFSAVARVRPDRFTADVHRLQARQAPLAADFQAQQDGTEVGGDAAARAAVCSPGSWGPGRYVPVRYGPSVGYLVFRRPQGETQVADLFLCGGEEAVRSVTLPRR